MPVDPVSTLVSGVQTAVFFGLYGLLVGVLWTPFLVSGRLRALFESLPPADWRVNYALWIPLPSVVWGLFFVSALAVSPDLRGPTRASELYVAGVDGITVATLVSILVWPVLLLYVLPARGIDWDSGEYGPKTVALVVGGLVWYLLFLVGPAYVLSVFAGFGDAMTGT